MKFSIFTKFGSGVPHPIYAFFGGKSVPNALTQQSVSKFSWSERFRIKLQNLKIFNILTFLKKCWVGGTPPHFWDFSRKDCAKRANSARELVLACTHKKFPRSDPKTLEDTNVRRCMIYLHIITIRPNPPTTFTSGSRCFFEIFVSVSVLGVPDGVPGSRYALQTFCTLQELTHNS